MIDCKSVAKVRGKLISCFVRMWKDTFQIPTRLVPLLKIVTSLCPGEPNRKNSPEVSRCVLDISRHTSGVNVYIIVDIYLFTCLHTLMVLFTRIFYFVFARISVIVLLLNVYIVAAKGAVSYHAL